MVDVGRSIDMVAPGIVDPRAIAHEVGKPSLIDTRLLPDDDLPDNAMHRYVAAIAAIGSRAVATNLTGGWQAIMSRGQILPLTIEDGATGGSYVTQPHSAYALYAAMELDEAGLHPALRLPARLGIAALGALLRAGSINRIVQIDNQLLATNLHGGWDGSDLPAIRALLTQRFPTHLLGIRSLEDWGAPKLLAAARKDGWVVVPARQIWVIDDLERDWTPRNNCANDRRALRKSGLVVERVTTLSARDAERVAALYHMLYVERHSALNPVFNARFVQTSCDSGLIAYTLLRDADGAILAAFGTVTRSGVMTVPLLGYDMTRPAAEGLYRIASYLYMQEARENGLRLNGSAGAGHFKRQRGARGIVEYTAFYTRHLPARRRAVIAALRAIMDNIAMPAMVKRGI